MKRKWLPWVIAGGIVILLIVLAIFVWEYDEDRISPLVRLASFNDRLFEAMEERFGVKYGDLPDSAKIHVLAKIARETDQLPEIRAAAIRILGKFAQETRAAEAIVHALADSSYLVTSEAIMAIGKGRIPGARPALKELIERLQSASDNSILLSDMEYLAMTGRMNDEDVVFDFHEAQNTRMAFDDGNVYEINLFLPQGALYYLSFPNCDDNWENFFESDFMEALRELPAYQDLMELGPFRSLRQVERRIEERFGGLSRYMTPERLFRDDVKYAHFPDGNLIVTFAGKNVDMALSIFEIIGGIGGGRYVLDKKTIFGTELHTVRSVRSGRGVSFAKYDEYFLLSDSPELLEKSLHTFAEDRFASVTALPAFQQTYAQVDLKGEEHFCYLFCTPQFMVESHESPGRSRFLMKLANDVLYRLPAGTQAADDATTVPGSQNARNIYRAIPSDALSFLILDAFDPRLFWDYILRYRTLSESALDSLESGSGITVRNDILPHLEDGGFISYSGIRYGADYQSNLSVLKSVVGLSSDNAGELVRPLTRLYAYLFRNPPLEESYHDHQLYVCSAAGTQNNAEEEEMNTSGETRRDEPLTPCFAATSDGILFSMNRAMLMKHLDAYSSRTASAYPAGLRPGVLREQLIFRTAPILRDFYSFLRRYARRTTQFTDREVEERIRPLLPLLETCHSIHGWFKEYRTLSHGQLTCDMTE